MAARPGPSVHFRYVRLLAAKRGEVVQGSVPSMMAAVPETPMASRRSGFLCLRLRAISASRSSGRTDRHDKASFGHVCRALRTRHRFAPQDSPRKTRRARTRKRDPVAILAGGDRTRVPELIPERYKRMLVSPFTFLRGAAAVMAQDLKHEPSAGIPLQACGDCHLMNFGAFDTPEELILFDINDFDETLPGVDFTVDLKRLAASVAVAALDAKFSNKRARAAAATTVAAYRTRMRVLAKLSPLEIWHSRIELAREIKRIDDRTLRSQLHAIITNAGKRLQQDDNFPHLVKGNT